jgi:YggT family protein
VATLWRVINQLTEPVLRPIRRILPPMGGLDLSPIVVFVILFFLQSFIANDLPRLLRLY